MDKAFVKFFSGKQGRDGHRSSSAAVTPRAHGHANADNAAEDEQPAVQSDRQGQETVPPGLSYYSETRGTVKLDARGAMASPTTSKTTSQSSHTGVSESHDEHRTAPVLSGKKHPPSVPSKRMQLRITPPPQPNLTFKETQRPHEHHDSTSLTRTRTSSSPPLCCSSSCKNSEAKPSSPHLKDQPPPPLRPPPTVPSNRRTRATSCSTGGSKTSASERNHGRRSAGNPAPAEDDVDCPETPVRHEPFNNNDMNNVGGLLSPNTPLSGASSPLHTASSSGDLTICSPQLATATAGSRSQSLGASPQTNSVRRPRNFYFHSKPRLNRFTGMISYLLRQGEKNTVGVPADRRSEEEQKEYRKLFALSFLVDLCEEATKIMSLEPTVLNIKVKVSLEELVVVGDIHGQYMDFYTSVLSQQFNTRTKNKERIDKMFFFLGDFVDRGPNSLETILLVLALKIEYPHMIFILRGNHEEKATSRVYGFLTELQTKLGELEGTAIWEVITSTFGALPLCAIVNVENKVKEKNFSFFAAHGGISPKLLAGLEPLHSICRGSYGLMKIAAAAALQDQGSPVRSPRAATAKPLSLEDEDMCRDLMWSDPTNDVGLFSKNPRGCGYLFGPTASATFCDANNVSFIIRAHQVVMDGYLWKHNERVLTVFSAPNYCGVNNNLGAIMIVRNEEEPVEASSPAREKKSATPTTPRTKKGTKARAPAEPVQEEKFFHRYLAFAQYEAAEDIDDDVVFQPTSTGYPYSSYFT